LERWQLEPMDLSVSNRRFPIFSSVSWAIGRDWRITRLAGLQGMITFLFTLSFLLFNFIV